MSKKLEIYLKPNFDKISQQMAHRVGNVLLGLGLVTASVYEGGNLFSRQISIRFLNPRLR